MGPYGAITKSVYVSTAKGITQYVGITNNIARRAAEHSRNKGILIDELMPNLSVRDARAMEQEKRGDRDVVSWKKE